MRIRPYGLTLLCLNLFFILAACNYTPRNFPESTASPEPTAGGFPEPSPSGAAAALPLYLPLPVYEVFSAVTTAQDELDAFLHRTAVTYYSMRIGDAREGHLVIPSLRLIDTWEAEDGDTYYLCLAAEVTFYGLAQDIRSGGPYSFPNAAENWTGLGSPVRFKVAKTGLKAGEYNYWEYHCTEILETPQSGDGQTGGSPLELSVMCENRPDTLERLTRYHMGNPGEYMDGYIRDILPAEIAHDRTALLETYLMYFKYPALSS